MSIKDSIVTRLPEPIYFNLKRLDYRINRTEHFNTIMRLRNLETSDSGSYKPFVSTKSIFVHLPKCAGISVNKALYGNLAGGHSTLEQYSVVFSYKELRDFFLFTIVRNPWDRLTSAYTFLKKGGMNKWDQDFADKELNQFASFKEFVKEWLPNEKNRFKHHHFKPQMWYLTEKHNRLKVDYVAYLENLDKDFEYIKSKVNHHAQLSKINVSQSKDYKTLYDDETIDIVQSIYAEDIAAFGYTFDNSNLPSLLAERDRNL